MWRVVGNTCGGGDGLEVQRALFVDDPQQVEMSGPITVLAPCGPHATLC